MPRSPAQIAAPLVTRDDAPERRRGHQLSSDPDPLAVTRRVVRSHRLPCAGPRCPVYEAGPGGTPGPLAPPELSKRTLHWGPEANPDGGSGGREFGNGLKQVRSPSSGIMPEAADWNDMETDISFGLPDSRRAVLWESPLSSQRVPPI
ncbi:hypothetical protein PG993_008436 [Apiospora rasikravindrae]|uniref:Uncharacterized protein n=1 Tax=Apiospora rasikravindrae TaxID=990691 RepID=A0ABR1T254_9PEZI